MAIGILSRACLCVLLQFGAAFGVFFGMRQSSLPLDATLLIGCFCGAIYVIVTLLFMCDKFIVTKWRYEVILLFGCLLEACLGACLGVLMPSAISVDRLVHSFILLSGVMVGVFMLMCHARIRGLVARISRTALLSYGVILVLAFLGVVLQCTAGAFSDRFVILKLAPESNATVVNTVIEVVQNARPEQPNQIACHIMDIGLILATIVFYALMIAWDLNCLLPVEGGAIGLVDGTGGQNLNALAAKVSVHVCVDLVIIVANLLHFRRPRRR